MRTFLTATVCAMICAVLSAQTPARAVNTSPDSESLTKEERNIRAYVELLRTDLRKSKAQIMGEVMQLDTDAAQKFWPIYKEFETELMKIGDQITSAVGTYAKNYSQMTDAMADQLANKILAIESQRNALKKKYYDRMKNSVGGITAMRFLQVENQLERLVDLQIASQLPVVGE